MEVNTVDLPTDTARIAVLHGYGVLDSDPETAFDDLARFAAESCRTPFAAISFVDESREWVKAAWGWRGETIPRDRSFSALAIDAGAPFFLIPDAQQDDFRTEFPQVRHDPQAAFYAAVLLVAPTGEALGTLSVFDDRPRLLDDAQVAMLQALGRQVMSLLDLRREVRNLTTALSARVRAEQSAQWQAGHDSLTGLPNRALFLQRVEDALARTGGTGDARSSNPLTGRAGFPAKKNLAVLFVDLDRFKRINDTLGHSAGDSLLREVAARFSGCLCPEDTLARLGGDEFTVLLTNVPNASYAAGVCQMLLRTLRRPIILCNQELYVGASIGISTFPQDGEDAQTLLKHADIAMYQAKERGGYQVYSRLMNADGYQRLIEEGELRQAIEQDELSLLYQPLVNAVTGAVQGAEALARWKHPQRGQVPPAHFIALAGQADLIVPLGEWVFRRACADASFWRRNGHPGLRVSVNLSARQLSQPRLAEFLEALLIQEGIPGSALELELTETALFGSGDATPATLQHLRSLGIRVSVDDFGTGYSSLAYLRRFAVDAIKIDRAFVAGLGQNRTDEAIVRALIEMAHALRIQVIAEGVETAEQRDRLLVLGCDTMQGYLFSRPVTAEGLRTVFSSAERSPVASVAAVQSPNRRGGAGTPRRRPPLLVATLTQPKQDS
ncbi:MAG: EAL domain-containing protein [Cytophagales bacterium]|nr:EAL domain-containing protein [Armatimonadota bacterium]